MPRDKIKFKLAIALGTRPEIIKLAPVIRECVRKKVNFFIIHTGQHYSYEMDKIIWRDLSLLKPKYNLEVGSGSHSFQTAKILEKSGEIFEKERPTVVMAQGDTNSVLAVSLAAAKLQIKVAHVEAGLRSYDRRMPEETNRVLTDHLSTYLFAPTILAKNNLKAEGILGPKVLVVGNTIVDSVKESLVLAKKKSSILTKLNLKSRKYIFITLHRPENVDSKERLETILSSLKELSEKIEIEFVWAIHPRTKSMINKFKLSKKYSALTKIKIIDPVGFLDALRLQADSALVLTDSGGLQEEACILKVPCVTLRENTERPESIKVKANVLSSPEKSDLEAKIELMLKSKKNWRNPFGDGKSARRIISHLLTEKT